MDLTDRNPKDTEPGMGNEVSQADGVKQSVGGGGQIGQFHRVLVESEYSVPDFKGSLTDLPSDSTTDGVQQRTDKLKSENGLELNSAEDGASKGEGQIKPGASGDGDYSLIEECKALITEAADRAVHRSLSRTSTAEQVTDLDEIQASEAVEEIEVIEQAKSVSVLNVEPAKPGPSLDSTYSEIPADNGGSISKVTSEQIESEFAKPVKGSHIDLNYALKCGIITNSAEKIFDSNKIQGKGKKRKSKSADNIFRREVVESVKQHFDNEDNLDKDRPTADAKRPKGSFIAKMFKFSKRKPRAESDDSFDAKTEKENSIVEESNVQSPTPDDGEHINENHSSEIVRQVKRLNSLDSGIVVDKSNEQGNNVSVEYAVVKKTKPKVVNQTEASGSMKGSTKEVNEAITKENVAQLSNANEQKEVLYVNGDKFDEDYVYVNERGVDVEGLIEPENTLRVETSEGSEFLDKVREKLATEDERRSNISTDSGASSGSKIQRSDVTQPEKAKLKKKSWSFQLMGRKDKPEDPESGSVVSMDPNPSRTDGKKSKWRFGKFSFRKDNEGVSSSTPDLHKAGIPEGEEVKLRKRPEEKKKMKLKNLKLKKDKRKSSDKGRNSLDSRSVSMINISPEEHLQPRSRRSIVEEDLPYTQTDVFEGVSLSDLSQDEDAEVSTNPAGKPSNEKKNGSMKTLTSLLGKKADKDTTDDGSRQEKHADPHTKTEIQVKTPEFIPDIGGSQSEKGETSVTKIDEAEGTVEKDVDLSENTPVQLCSKSELTIIEDEYVNIISSKAQTTESVFPQNINMIAEENEYAQIVKTKIRPAQGETNIETIKSIIPVQVLKLENVKILKGADTESNKLEETDNSGKLFQDEIVQDENPNAEIVQKTRENAFSNLIYSDEEFRASIATLEKAKPEHEDESDAYVELQQIVENLRDNKEEATMTSVEENVKENPAVSVDDKEVTEKPVDEIAANTDVAENDNLAKLKNENVEAVETIVAEKFDKSESMPVEQGLIQSEDITNRTEIESSEPVKHVTRNDNVIVMKDVGVQVPDIYMPLDKDKDFGFSASNVPSVSIGIQVTDEDLNIEHVVVSLKTGDDSKPQKDLSPAFF